MSSTDDGGCKPLRACVVIWDDAHQDTEDYKIESLGDTKGVRTQSVGWLVTDNEHGIIIASDQYPDADEHKEYVKGRGFIPWGMIVDWYILDDE